MIPVKDCYKCLSCGAEEKQGMGDMEHRFFFLPHSASQPLPAGPAKKRTGKSVTDKNKKKKQRKKFIPPWQLE